MKCRDGLFLQGRSEIDQDVAATDEIHPGEGRIGEEMLPGEDDHIAELLHNPVAAVLLEKKRRNRSGDTSCTSVLA